MTKLAWRDDALWRGRPARYSPRTSLLPQGKLSGKEASPGKGKFKGTFCWDGLTTPQSVATVTWWAVTDGGPATRPP